MRWLEVALVLLVASGEDGTGVRWLVEQMLRAMLQSLSVVLMIV